MEQVIFFIIGAATGALACFFIVIKNKAGIKKEIKKLEKEIKKEKATIQNLKVVAKEVKNESSSITIDDLVQQLAMYSK